MRLVRLIPAALALGACTRFSSGTPEPVANTLGDVQETSNGVSYVMKGQGYVVTSPNREVLPDVKDALDNSARQYHRYFGEDPAEVNVRLVYADSLPPAPDSTAAKGDRSILFPIRAHSAEKSKEHDHYGNQQTSSAPRGLAGAVAHAWLMAYADERKPRDTTTIKAAASRGPLSLSDTRIPDWYETSATELLAGSPLKTFAGMQLVSQPKLIPLSALFSEDAPPPPGRDSTIAASGSSRAPGTEEGGMYGGRHGGGGHGRGGYGGANGANHQQAKEMPQWMLYRLEAISVGQYIAEREGPGFIGKTGDALIRGESMETVLSGAKLLPSDIPSLEKEWRSWLADQAPRANGNGYSR